MSIKENAGKVGYGSWYCHQSYSEEIKAQMTYKEFNRKIHEQCHDRLVEEITVGDLVKLQYVGGNKPLYYKGTVEDLFFNDSFDSGYVTLKQSKTSKVLDTCFIDDIQVLKKAEVESL